MSIKINIPFADKKEILSLKAGDKVFASGIVYTARDAAHQRMRETIEQGGKLPFDIQNQIIYYAGPAPTPKGKAIGAIGPTTSTRMDPYTPLLLELGLEGMIGKGKRNLEVIESIKKHQSIYFAAIGGAAALMAKSITAMEVIAYDDLGAESIKKLTLKDFPLIVAIDAWGNDYYQVGQKLYLEKFAPIL